MDSATELTHLKPKKTPYKKYVPIVTLIVGLTSIVLFIGINLERASDVWDIYRKWGAPSAIDIFKGSYWGLVTSNFVHTELWHIGFNLYWIWVFGKKIEYESNKVAYVFLIVTAALMSSFAQLGFAEATGIGLSGIGYAFFGFLFIKSRSAGVYEGFLEKRIINLFLIWLVACVVLTWLDLWNIGNAAHIAGMIWGMTIAYVSRLSVIQGYALVSAIFLVIGTAFLWNPLATSWLSYQAYELHENQQFDEAEAVYKQILKKDSDNEFATINVERLEMIKLYDRAFEYHSKKEYRKARELYLEILEKNPNDEWAKENLSRLPD